MRSKVRINAGPRRRLQSSESFRARVCVVGWAVSLAGGCEKVLGVEDYRVLDAAKPDTLLRAVVASGSTACSECLSHGVCARTFELCAAVPGCAELVACLFEDPSPAAVARCDVRLEPSEGVRVAAGGVQGCYSGCLGECHDAQAFECAHDYVWPGNFRKEPLRIVQSLSVLDVTSTRTPLADATVAFCSSADDCANAPSARTGADGFYSIDLEIPVEPPPLAGFRGYRVVQRSDLMTQALRANIPLLTDQTETTMVLSRAATDLLEYQTQNTWGSSNTPRGIVMFQVFDCNRIGAGGARVEVPDSPGSRVFYKGDVGVFAVNEDSTLASQEGAGLIIGLEPERAHRIEVYSAAGELVGEDEIFVPSEVLVFSALYPKARSN